MGLMLLMAAAEARAMAGAFRGMGRFDLAARCEADAHAMDAQRGALNAEGRALVRAAQEQGRTFQHN